MVRPCLFGARSAFLLVAHFLLCSALLWAPRNSLAGGVVNNCTEADLRAALVGGGTVTFACNGTITISSPLSIGNNCSLDGAAHDVIISGGDATRIFEVQPGVTFSMSRLTIANGRSQAGIGGAGFLNYGNSRLFECTFSNNVALGIPVFGGAIYHNAGELRINACTFINNQSQYGGGAVAGRGTFNPQPPEAPSVFITNSTFFGNSAPARGAAILSLSSTFVVANCTFAQNGSWAVSGSTSGPIRLVNTVLAFNGTNNCSSVTDSGHNLSTDTSGNFNHPASLQNTDPLLGSLANNGGRTLTLGLLAGSPAIDSADRLACPATDQRGVGRPYAYGCDRGAFETTSVGSGPGEFRFTSTSYTQLEDNESVVITVYRATGVAGTASVNLATANGSALAGSDYVGTNVTLIFADGEGSKSLAIPLLTDTADEGTESFEVVLTNPGGGALLTTPSSATVSILNDDAVQVVNECTENALRQVLGQIGRIQFACDGTITLSNTLVIATNAVIDATGRDVVISGGGAKRLFLINPGVRLGLLHLTLADGLALGTNGSTGQPGEAGEGGAIYNDSGMLTATDCKFLGHRAQGGTGGPARSGGAARGGALHTRGGQVTLTNCAFDDNQARGGNAGGGNVSGSSGGAGGQASGGAICAVDARVELLGCTLSRSLSSSGRNDRGNGTLAGSATTYGGAIDFDGGEMKIARSILRDNIARADYSAFSASIGSAHGGAILQRRGSLVIIDSTLVANLSQGGEGMLISTPSGHAGGHAYGGAISLVAGTCELNSSTLVSNRAVGGQQLGYLIAGSAYGGAVFNSTAGLTVLNCTLAHNEANAGKRRALEGGGYGGALHNEAGAMTVRHATISGNAARNSPGTNSSPEGPESGGAIYSGATGLVTLANTIIANSLAGSNAFGLLVDQAGNLSSDGSGNFSGLGSLNNKDPILGPLGNYGGPTPTMALLAGSPAINAAASPLCLPTDQRGRPRPSAGVRDIGSFESGEPYTILGRLIGYLPPTGTAQIESGTLMAQVDRYGQYSLQGLNAATHTLRPASPLAVFVPKSRDVAVLADTVGIDFASYRSNAVMVTRLPLNTIQGLYAGEAGVTYNVQRSPGLPPAWGSYLSLTADAEGLIRWTEPVQTPNPIQLFRVERP
jgi:hypothetical protein